MKVLHSPLALLCVLIAITLGSFALFEVGATPMIAGLAIVALAGLKVGFIMAGYMEIRWRHRPVGPALFAWLATSMAILVAGYTFA